MTTLVVLCGFELLVTTVTAMLFAVTASERIRLPVRGPRIIRFQRAACCANACILRWLHAVHKVLIQHRGLFLVTDVAILGSGRRLAKRESCRIMPFIP